MTKAIPLPLPARPAFTWPRAAATALLLAGLGALAVQAQPGFVCGTPLAITSLPFNDAGNTSAYGDDYANADIPPLAPDAVTTGTGSPYYITGDDVVYAYTPPADQLITIHTTNDDDWIGLWAFTGCPFASLVGYHTSISGATRTISQLPVSVGVTYYFVISTWAAPQSTDYTIEITLDWSSVPCSALPEPGATTGPATSCPDTPFTLGTTAGYSEMGITFQWEISTDGTTWANAPGSSTGPTYTTTQDVTSWYRCQVTCDVAGTAASTPHEVTALTAAECFCIPTGAQNNTDEILNFTLANLNNSSATLEATDGYMDYTTTVAPAQLTAGVAYVASLTTGSGSGNHGAAIWIDYDDSGTFEATEKVVQHNNTIGPNSTVSFPAFLVQQAPGVHRLRVQYAHNLAGSALNPCTITTQFAETEDYLVEVVIAEDDCLGIPGGPAQPGTTCTTAGGLPGIWNDACECLENVGVAELEAAPALALFPNPARTELLIPATAGRPLHAHVLDMTGRQVLERPVNGRLDLAALAPGSYTLLITDGQGTLQGRGRFVKQ